MRKSMMNRNLRKDFFNGRSQTVIPEDVKKEILAYLTKTIDARVEAIVGGGHRGSYYKAARLGARWARLKSPWERGTARRNV